VPPLDAVTNEPGVEAPDEDDDDEDELVVEEVVVEPVIVGPEDCAAHPPPAQLYQPLYWVKAQMTPFESISSSIPEPTAPPFLTMPTPAWIDQTAPVASVRAPPVEAVTSAPGAEVAALATSAAPMSRRSANAIDDTLAKSSCADLLDTRAETGKEAPVVTRSAT
jgi:hypothetical protein